MVLRGLTIEEIARLRRRDHCEVGDKGSWRWAGSAGRGCGPDLGRTGSPVQVIAGAAVIRCQPEQLALRHRQPGLAGEVTNLASQPAVIAAARRAGAGVGKQQCRAFILHSRFMPEKGHNVKKER